MATPTWSGIDADIDQAPFARLAPDQPWRPWHRYQHLYMWVLYGFLTLQWFLISDFVDLKNHGIGHQRFARQPRRRDIGMIAVGKMLHIGWAVALPLVYHRWWVVLTFYLGDLVDRRSVAGDHVPTRPLRAARGVSRGRHSHGEDPTSSPINCERPSTCTAAPGSVVGHCTG